MEDLFGGMEAIMRGNGRIIVEKEKAKKYIQLETILKVSFLEVNLKVKGNMFLKMEDTNKENGKILSWKEKGYMYGIMVIFMKVNLRMDKFTGMELNLTKIEIF